MSSPSPSTRGGLPRRRVFVTVGTDHHRFDRLVRWVDELAANRPDLDVVVQYGSATPPEAATGHAFLGVEELGTAMAEADVVVAHGGPATLMEARSHGHRPIIVPRDPDLDEHVDDHQLRFTRQLAGDGTATVVHDRDSLFVALDETLAVGRQAQPGQLEGTGIHTLSRLVDELLADAAGASADRAADRPTVLFVGGLGRSGSTLLTQMLGQLPDTQTLGEVTHLVARGLIDDELCGCGLPFRSCPFWAEVGRVGFGGWDRVDVGDWARRQVAVDRTRFVPALLAGRRPRAGLDGFTPLLGTLYRAAATVSGASVLIDSSKHLSTAAVLRHVDDIDLRVVHLVRDSRGVANSWTRRRQRPEAADGRLMPQYHPANSAGRWMTDNVGFELLARRVPTIRVRYEDLLAEPTATLLAVAGFAGLDLTGPPDFLDDDTLLVTSGLHSVGGNPMRFTRGEIALREDRGWRSEMPAADRRLVSGITAPLRWRYRYTDRRLGRRPAMNGAGDR